MTRYTLVGQNRAYSMRGFRGGGVRTPPPPLKNHNSIGFLSNIDLSPLKFTKLPSQHPLLGHHRSANETPFILLVLSSAVFESSLPLSTKKLFSTVQELTVAFVYSYASTCPLHDSSLSAKEFYAVNRIS